MIPTPRLFSFRSFLGTILISGFRGLSSPMAQQGDSVPQTTSDRAINLKALALQATPLEKEELLVELEAWQELLKAEAKAIAALEIQELSVTPDGKKALLDSLNQKRIERTQVADRMIVIMNAYQTKGGDIAPTEATSVRSQAFNSISRNWVKAAPVCVLGHFRRGRIALGRESGLGCHRLAGLSLCGSGAR